MVEYNFMKSIKFLNTFFYQVQALAEEQGKRLEELEHEKMAWQAEAEALSR